MPLVARTSFSAIGMPAIGVCVAPVVAWTSTAWARSRATSGVGVRIAFTSPSTASTRAERRLGQLGGGEVARAELLGELGPGEVTDVAHEPVSAIRGTLNRPRSASGAFASAAA